MISGLSVYDVPCSWCNANPPNPCVTNKGVNREEPHGDRPRRLRGAYLTLPMVVEVTESDEALNLTVGEKYSATPHGLNPFHKITLLRDMETGAKAGITQNAEHLKFVRWLEKG